MGESVQGDFVREGIMSYRIQQFVHRPTSDILAINDNAIVNHYCVVLTFVKKYVVNKEYKNAC